MQVTIYVNWHLCSVRKESIGTLADEIIFSNKSDIALFNLSDVSQTVRFTIHTTRHTITTFVYYIIVVSNWIMQCISSFGCLLIGRQWFLIQNITRPCILVSMSVYLILWFGVYQRNKHNICSIRALFLGLS